MSIQLKAGFGKVSITPEYSVPLYGYGNSHLRMSTNVLDPIYAICVALTDGESTILVYNLDLTAIADDDSDFCRSVMEQEFGIPKQNILLNATHNHSSPDLYSPLDCIQKDYKPFLRQQVILAAKMALADLSEATLFIGSDHIPGYNFVRRYLLSDGTYGGDNFGDFANNTILGHETEADAEMQAVRLAREGKKDIVLCNWQGHPHRTGGSRAPDLSSDLIEYIRRTAEEKEDVLVAVLQGCGGNINHDSRIKEEMISTSHVEIGTALGEGLVSILGKMRPAKSGKISSVTRCFTARINHDWDHKVEDAKKVLDHWPTCETPREARLYANKFGFNSVYHAMYVISRSEMPETESYEIGGVSFGDVCLVWTADELYDVTGMYLKASSPFETTFVMGYTNGERSYMPTIKAFAHGGYGCDICNFPAGTTEKLTEEMLDLIVALKK